MASKNSIKSIKGTAAPKLFDQRVLRAEAHPIRVGILSILSEGPNTPARMSRRMGDNVSLNLVSYHIKQLLRYGCIELVREGPSGNGGIEHTYRTIERQFIDTKQWEKVDPTLRHPITATILRMVGEDTSRSLAEGKFDVLPNNHLSRSPVELDMEGWEEVADLLNTALDGILEAHGKSAERVSKSGEKRMVARVVMMQYLIGRNDPREQEDDGP
ncbi:MAG TPA: helix-turn-helix domain-containing protein [Solirubrobacterales bacterium]|nr:helix-turn-helix domain-containing protein [Solirubrobacterales bacterium]